MAWLCTSMKIKQQIVNLWKLGPLKIPHYMVVVYEMGHQKIMVQNFVCTHASTLPMRTSWVSLIAIYPHMHALRALFYPSAIIILVNKKASYFKWLILFSTKYTLNFLLLPHAFYWEAVHQNGSCKHVPHLRYADLWHHWKCSILRSKRLATNGNQDEDRSFCLIQISHTLHVDLGCVDG